MWRSASRWAIGLVLAGCAAPPAQPPGQPGADSASLDSASLDSASPDSASPDSAAGDSAAADSAAPPSCNGAPQLCDRPLDQVAFAASHNAMSAADLGWALPNQPHGMIRQLDDGVRALLIDLHAYDVDDGKMPLGETALCHGFCVLGAQRWSDAAAELAAWLAGHPHEVVVLIIEDHVPVAAIAAGLGKAGLLERVYAHPAGTAWPTLGQLSAQGTPLLVLTESAPQPGAPAWQHGYHDVLFDNPYAAAQVQDFSCAVARGKPGHALALLNHFLTKGLEKHDALAAQANTAAVLGAHAAQCRAQWQRQINFVAVDWYSSGALFSVVRQLNGLEP